MRLRIGMVLFVLLLLARPPVAAGQGPDAYVQELSLTGQQLKVLETAAAELRKHGLDVQGYAVSIYREGSGYLVMFEDPAITDRRWAGSSPNMSEFEVVIDAELKVLRASFVR